MCLLVFGLVSLQASARRTSQLRRNCWACEPRIWPNNLSSRARLRKYFWPVSHGTKRLCHICGKMHKKVWIAAGDIILVGLRDYQDDKADVILKYMPDEVRLLKAYGELPDGTKLNEGVAEEMEEKDDTGENYIEFEDEDIDKI